jgi:hypothetical protein
MVKAAAILSNEPITFSLFAGSAPPVVRRFAVAELFARPIKR